MHMHVSTTIRRSSALFLVLVTASACSDAVSPPRAAERPAFDIQALRPEASRTGPADHGPDHPPGPKVDDKNKTLTIDPNVSRTYAFGEDWVSFPAHSICDPEASGYGLGMWDTSCTPLDHPIKITVHWSSKGGYAYAHFSPDLRFVPADDQSVARWVVLSLYAEKKLHDLSQYNILYNAGPGLWVDEALSDPTLRAWLDPQHNSVVRRVKHFSGYMVAAAYSGLGGMGDAY
jgi:hypothetical protein